MAFQQFDQTQSYAARAAGTFDEGLRQYMLSIYNYMTLGVGITGLVAWLVAAVPVLRHLFLGTPLGFVSLLVMFGFGMFAFNSMRLSAAQLKTRFFIYSALMGICMSFIFLAYAKVMIAQAFFVTAGTFAGVSLVGYTTRRDLTSMGGFMMMGLIGIIIASLVNIFLHSAGLSFALSIITVIVFTGLIAWDTQRLKEQYASGYGVEANETMAVRGALSLYMNFINLFLAILRLMNGFNRD